MGKAFGILLLVAAVWVGAEVFTKGTQGAFGGALASLGGSSQPAEVQPWAGERAKASVGRAYHQNDDRLERLTGEGR